MTLKSGLGKLLQIKHAGVAKLADAQDLKSWAPQGACGFESRPRHFRISGLGALGFCSYCRSGVDFVQTLSKVIFWEGNQRPGGAYSDLSLVEGCELLHAFGEVTFRNNGVAAIYALGLMASELHCDRPRNAGALEISHRSSAEVVRNPSWYFRGETSIFPGVPGEFRICRHFDPRVQDELSQSFDFLIFIRGNQIQTGLFKGERVSPTR
jgi:hypothetical protein